MTKHLHISDDDVATEHRRDALSNAIHDAVRAWADWFGGEPDFEPDKEMCFCLAVKLGCFIAGADDERRECLHKLTRQVLDDAVAVAPRAEGELLKLMAERRASP